MSELLTRAIDRLADRRDLTETDAAEALAEIMAGEATDIEIAGFLIALRVKGETVRTRRPGPHDARLRRVRADRR